MTCVFSLPDRGRCRARISRTTAYRYFPSQRALLLAAQPELQPDTLLGSDAPSDPEARLDAFMAAFTRYNFHWEPQLRTARALVEDAIHHIGWPNSDRA